MLEVLGLSPDEYDLYRTLVEVASATPTDLGSAVGMPVADVSAYLSALEQRGLVGRHVDGSEEHFTASPPTVALGSLIVERQRWLRRAEIELERLNDLYRKAADDRTASDLVDLVPDWAARQAWACGPAGLLDALAERWQQAGIPDALHVERFQPPTPTAVDGSGGTVRFTASGSRYRSHASRKSASGPAGPSMQTRTVGSLSGPFTSIRRILPITFVLSCALPSQ